MTRRNKNHIVVRLSSFSDLQAFTHTVRQLMQHTDGTDKSVHATYRTLHELDRIVARRQAKGKQRRRNGTGDQSQHSDQNDNA